MSTLGSWRRSRAVGRLAGLVVAVLLGTAGVAAPAQATEGDAYISEANEERLANGLLPLLRYSAIAEAAAEERAQAMAASGTFAHDLGPLIARLGEAGVCWWGVAEIIALNGRRDVAYAMQQWMGSDGHRRIVLHPRYDEAAGSWADTPAESESRRRYHVMYFIDPCDSPAPPQPLRVAFATPAPGAAISGSVRWEAVPTGAPVSRIEFLVDGRLRWTERFPPYRFNGDTGAWDTRLETPAPHELVLRAVGSDGSVATATVRVLVVGGG